MQRKSLFSRWLHKLGDNYLDARRIGRDAAFALASRGHYFFAATFTDEQASELRAYASRKTVPLEVFKLDITNSNDRQKVLLLEIDVLINNAGIGESGSLAEVDVNRIRQVFEVNLFATLELTQLVSRGMIVRERGAVLFVISIAGRIPMPFLMPYSMSKFALSAAGAGLRAEMDQLGKHIHVALIEPGTIRTGFNQAMADSKYLWMSQQSYFRDQVDSMKEQERRTFTFLEARDTRSIVAKIVQASEAKRPKLRYVAPWIQGFGVRLARIIGV